MLLTISKNYHFMNNLEIIIFIITISQVFADQKGKYNRKINEAGKYVPDTAGWYIPDGLGFYVRDDRGIYEPDGKGFYTLNGEGQYSWNGNEFVIVSETDPFIPNIDYKYDILTKDKIRIKQIGGYVKNGSNKEILRVKGSYSYIGADKKIYVVEYISAENGFKVTGTHMYEPDSVEAKRFLAK